MISLTKVGNIANTPTNEYMLKSTDTKPTMYVPNGSTAFEMDTGKLFVFDAETNTWLEI